MRVAILGLLLLSCTKHQPADTETDADTDADTDSDTDTDTYIEPTYWLVQPSDVNFVGSFDVPNVGPQGGDLAYGGTALGVDTDRAALFFGGHDWYQELGEISIPAIGTLATVLQDPDDVLDGHLGDIDTDTVKLGGTLVYNDRLIITAYSYYDADGSQTASHFVTGLDVSAPGDTFGPFVMTGTANARSKAGYMTLIPDEWQGPFGGPALTGGCCLSILGNSSAGPSATVFDPDDVGVVNPIPGHTVLFYPAGNANTGNGTSSNAIFIQSDGVWGVAFPPGSRSVLFIGTHGDGTYCYGPGTDDPSLHGTPDGEGNTWCYDPVYSSKGTHAWPYHHQIWAYDAEDLLRVLHGEEDAWAPVPYATFQLVGMNDDGGATMAGATYDPGSGRLFITQRYGEVPKVYVYQILPG